MIHTRESSCYEFELQIVRTLQGQRLFGSCHIRWRPVTVDTSVSRRLRSVTSRTPRHGGARWSCWRSKQRQGLSCCPVWMSVRAAMRSILYGSHSSSINGSHRLLHMTSNQSICNFIKSMLVWLLKCKKLQNGSANAKQRQELLVKSCSSNAAQNLYS